MDDDATLVQQSIAGDPVAFGGLYDRYARVIGAVCFDATGDVDEAQELMQEAFLRAYVRLSRLRRPDRFAPWIISIARFVCREWRRRRRRDRHEYTGQTPESEYQTGEVGAESAQRLRLAIARLPETERLALHYFYLNGESADAAREALGLSPSGFYKALARARGQLASLLRNEEETV